VQISTDFIRGSGKITLRLPRSKKLKKILNKYQLVINPAMGSIPMHFRHQLTISDSAHVIKTKYLDFLIIEQNG